MRDKKRAVAKPPCPRSGKASGRPPDAVDPKLFAFSEEADVEHLLDEVGQHVTAAGESTASAESDPRA
jgi:hypothetical protein